MHRLKRRMLCNTPALTALYSPYSVRWCLVALRRRKLRWPRVGESLAARRQNGGRIFFALLAERRAPMQGLRPFLFTFLFVSLYIYISIIYTYISSFVLFSYSLICLLIYYNAEFVFVVFFSAAALQQILISFLFGPAISMEIERRNASSCYCHCYAMLQLLNVACRYARCCYDYHCCSSVSALQSGRMRSGKNRMREETHTEMNLSSCIERRIGTRLGKATRARERIRTKERSSSFQEDRQNEAE